MKHGTTYGYKQGCRCTGCYEAASVYRKKWWAELSPERRKEKAKKSSDAFFGGMTNKERKAYFSMNSTIRAERDAEKRRQRNQDALRRAARITKLYGRDA